MTDVKFITRDGLKSAKKAADHKIEGFMDIVYFKEEVLKKYEANKKFTIGDNGTVMFGDKWGTFRGVFRVAKGFLAAHLGDIGEGFPNEELKYWKQFNVSPSKIPRKERYFDFRETIRRMLHFMERSNERIERHLTKFFFDLSFTDKRLFKLDDVDNILRNLKRVINKNTTIDEFQSRIIFLNILLLETINTELINQIFKKIDKNLCYSCDVLAIQEVFHSYLYKKTPRKLKSKVKGAIQPLKSLELLRKFVFFLRVHHDVTVSLKINDLRNLTNKKKLIYEKIKENFYWYYKFIIFGKEFPNRKYFEQYESKIKEDTDFLKLLNKFRNKTSAHGFNQEEYGSILKILKVDPAEGDYSSVYEKLITRVSYDIEHIYFNLICPDPPIKQYYLKYLRESLNELRAGSNTYQSIFEELVSYLYDFLELYPKMIKGVKEVYNEKMNDEKFIVELGSFIESTSYVIKERSQELVNLLIPGLKYEKALTIAHFAHIIKNSEEISSSFLKKILPIVYSGVKDKKTINVNFCSEHVMFCLIEKFPEKLNKNKLREIFKGGRINFDLVKRFIR